MPKAELIPFYSKGSERQPFSNYLNNTATWTLVAVGILGVAGLVQHTPQIGEILKDGAAMGAVAVGTFRALGRLQQIYNGSSQEVRSATLQRISEITKNPITIFRRTARPTSAS